MLNIQKILINACMSDARRAYRSLYGQGDDEILNQALFAGHLALENIANSDTLYHDVQHTIMVSSAGFSILKGKHLREGGVSQRDWLHFVIACFCHDIGFVQGVCRNDSREVFSTGYADGSVHPRTGSSDAQLGPWHVDRSKQFVLERFNGEATPLIDAQLVADMIEFTRFPVTEASEQNTGGRLGPLVRAADLIGQLGDPQYLRKIPALYYEFMEIGSLADMGYEDPDQMRRKYGDFFRCFIHPHITEALDHLSVTEEGRRWAATLFSHVYRVDRLSSAETCPSAGA